MLHENVSKLGAPETFTFVQWRDPAQNRVQESSMQSWPVEYRDGDRDLGPTGEPPCPAPDNADVCLG